MNVTTRSFGHFPAALFCVWLIAPLAIAEEIEEVLVIGRHKAAASDVVSQRLESDVPMDFLNAEDIARVGDSNVAAALRRVPGVSLVQDQFVYVRGLGERYSSTQLNGAVIPSPDLTRNVLPLNIFPADIIEVVSVQKAYSPDLPAAFGGGNIDIVTRTMPTDFHLSARLNTGWNSRSGDEGFSYKGGSTDSMGKDDGTRAMPTAIVQGIQGFRGDFSPLNIQNLARQAGSPITFEDAQRVNRELATSLYKTIDLEKKSLPADFEAEATGGYRWFAGENWDFGFLAIASYADRWRNRERMVRSVVEPDTNYAQSTRTINQITLTASMNVGVNFTDDHKVSWLNLFLRNTEDEATRTISCAQGQFNDCNASATQERLDDIRFERRDLDVTQFSGTHTLGVDTLAMLPDWMGFLDTVRDTEITWFYTDARAKTDLPNEVRVKFVETFDSENGRVLTSDIRNINNAATYGFSDLRDDVETWGGAVTVPFSGSNWDLDLGAGGSYSRKGRSYQQTILGLGTFDLNFGQVSDMPVDEAFDRANLLDPELGYELFLGIGQFGTESYAAGQIVDAAFGKFDFTFDDTWRLSGGARWEDFKQISVPIDYLNFSGQRIPLSADQIVESAFVKNDWYPALSATYMLPGFLSDDFQLRFAWSGTVARPDLREISASTYIDPLTEARVRGNPGLVPSDLTNYDFRAEWFWNTGDNMSFSLFYKDISDPIETVQGGATEDNILFTFINAESAHVVGVEVEAFKGLGFLSNGGWSDAFFLSGNATVSDSQVKIPIEAGVGNITRSKRRLTQQSNWVVNMQLGYDSLNGRHGATLVYNVFGERLYYAGIDGFADAFEQPFHSVDFVYSYYPGENWIMKLRLKNLLDEKIEIEQEGVTVLSQSIGQTIQFDIKYEL